MANYTLDWKQICGVYFLGHYTPLEYFLEFLKQRIKKTLFNIVISLIM